MKLTSMTIPLLGLGLAVAPALAQSGAATQQPARPGTVNYIEGAVSIDGQAVDAKQVGSIDLEAGQELTTGKGKAEVLLTPGVFLRVGDNSTVKLISPDLTNTQVQIQQGRAAVEVDEIHKENNLQVLDAGVTTRLQKTGYYEFDANTPEVKVFKGKADVELANGKSKEVKGNHAAALQAGLTSVKSSKFDEDNAKGDLYNWSRLRSQYLAEANHEIAGEYASTGYYPGWYWNPNIYGYTFIGGGPFMSPFGWGFYPLGWGYGGAWGGYYGGYYGGGYYGHRHYGNGTRRLGDTHGGTPKGGSVRGGSARGFGAPRSGGMGGGSHSMGGGGFHGGAGGGGSRGGGAHR